MQNSILNLHYLDYLDAIKNNKIVSHNLTNIEIQELFNKKYDLSGFDIYKYLTAYDYIND